MSDSFDMGDMQAALPTDERQKPEQSFQGPPIDREEAGKKAREHGFSAPTGYNYTGGADNNRNVSRSVRCDWVATGDVGNIAPRTEELEKILFSEEAIYGKGEHMDALESAEIEVIGENPVKPIATFKEMKLHPVIQETLKLMRYKEPTKIQKYVMPAVQQLRDVVVSAMTGSGKTVAYLCPIFSNLMGRIDKLAAPKWDPARYNPQTDFFRAEPLVLVLLPTRELAWQVFDECRRLCYRSGLRPCIAYGGAPLGEQREELMKGCDVLIATPGRLKDFLRNPKLLSLHRVRYTVIDEADELMDSDWVEDLQEILMGANLNENDDHVFMMFSATFPPSYRKAAKAFMREDFLRIKAGRTGASHANVKQQVLWVDGNKKNEALYDVLYAHPPGRTIVFVASKLAADKVDDFLFNLGLPCAALHSSLTQVERETAMEGFRSKKIPILVTTGVTARGIDVPNVLHVINFDLPSSMHGGITEYVHRIGRTGRLGHVGLATSFYNERNDDIAEDLTKILLETNQAIPEFLEAYRPIDGNIDFGADDSDAEEDGLGGLPADTGASGDDGAPAWGAPAANDDANGESKDDAWGAGASNGDATNGDAWGTGNSTEPANGAAW